MSDYDALLEEHKQLRLMRDRLTVIAATSAEVLPEFKLRNLLATELEEFSGTISVHFGHEEEGGYFSEVQARRPELSAQISQLQSEHENLVDQFADLAKQLREGAAIASVATTVSEALEVLSQHESAEDELLQDGMLTDIGAND